jgi:hypothetical protein
VPWPGLDGNVAQTAPVVPKPTPYDAFFSTNWLSAAGTIILIGDIIAPEPGRWYERHGTAGQGG